MSLPTYLSLSSQPFDDVTQEDEQRSQEGEFLMYHLFIASASMLEVPARGSSPESRESNLQLLVAQEAAAFSEATV